MRNSASVNYTGKNIGLSQSGGEWRSPNLLVWGGEREIERGMGLCGGGGGVCGEGGQW